MGSSKFASSVTLFLTVALLCTVIRASTVKADKQWDPSLVIYLFDQQWPFFLRPTNGTSLYRNQSTTVKTDKQWDPSLVTYLFDQLLDVFDQLLDVFDQLFDMPGNEFHRPARLTPGGDYLKRDTGTLGVAKFPVRLSADPSSNIEPKLLQHPRLMLSCLVRIWLTYDDKIIRRRAVINKTSKSDGIRYTLLVVHRFIGPFAFWYETEDPSEVVKALQQKLTVPDSNPACKATCTEDLQSPFYRRNEN
ncbi:hypothetical protein R1sor_013485 [Riccia sorocarpa]|uniref:Uncharacterized protein n=1 Tax=Riccia sorocarpa TaxID=122646 RepID=A0ABD3HAS5_9MARC